jgi:activator of 2-hydroxyglutaryl-CoA dehydratase
MTLDEMSLLSGNSQNAVSVNERCCVFADMDTHWLIHNSTPKEDIVQARNDAAAVRLNSLLNEKITLEKDVVMIGGLARNTGVVNALKKRSGIDFLIPEQPEFGSAIGAALIAAD